MLSFFSVMILSGQQIACVALERAKLDANRYREKASTKYKARLS